MPKRVLKPGRYKMLPYTKNEFGEGFILNCAEYTNRLAKPNFLKDMQVRAPAAVIKSRHRYKGHVVPTQFGLLDAAPAYLILPCESDELSRRPYEMGAINWIVFDIEEKGQITVIDETLLCIGELTIQLDQIDMTMLDEPIYAGTPAMSLIDKHIRYNPGDAIAFLPFSTDLRDDLVALGTKDALSLYRGLHTADRLSIPRPKVSEEFDADGLAWIQADEIKAVIMTDDPIFKALKMRKVWNRGSDGREEICSSSASALEAIGSQLARELGDRARTGRFVMHRYYAAPSLAHPQPKAA